jgi:hypothetical protein
MPYDKWFKIDGTWFSTDPANPCNKGKYLVVGDQMTYFHSNTDLCVQVDPVTIESLSEMELIIDTNFWEPLKFKYKKVIE